jgi:hypothetical protein
MDANAVLWALTEATGSRREIASRDKKNREKIRCMDKG